MPNRRDFLKTATTAAVASGLPTTFQGDVAHAQGQPAPSQAAVSAVSAVPPSSYETAMETGTLEDYTEAESDRYFVEHPNSDFMVDVIRSLGIEYLASNPAAGFRGLHESVVNYGGNKSPEFLTCLHEEHAVAMGHGYAKIALKPLLVACHGTVGLQHAAMAVYNAYCDRAPVIIIAGNHLEAAGRRPGAEWRHSAIDPALLVRDFTKWDDQPLSMTHFVESMIRAYRIAMTPPMGPVVISLDGHLQEEEFHDTGLTIPKFAPSVPPQGEVAALREAARLLVNAERPVIEANRVARTPEAMDLLVELAELLQAPVSSSARMNFPNDHYLSVGGGDSADVILGLELDDYWSSVYQMLDLPIKDVRRTAAPDVKLIHIGVNDLFTRANYQSFQRFMPVDLSITGDAQASLPTLIEEVKRALTPERRSKIAERADRFKAAFEKGRTNVRASIAQVWNLSPVSSSRIGVELWELIKNRDWSVVNGSPGGASRLWKMNRHYHSIGGSGGTGMGYGPPAAVGAALANRDQGRISINFQNDGDMMYTSGVLWTAAHHRIPLLTIMNNNRAYHQEVMHVQRMSNRRQRGTEGTAKIGNTFENPYLDFASLAKGMGVWSTGPITNPNDVGPALKRALEVIDRGEPALVDVVTQPRG